MTKETYLNLQRANLDQAIKLGKIALNTAYSIQTLFKNKDVSNPKDIDFTRDSLKYYDMNDALKQLEWMHLQLKDFKHEMIEIKIANDKMLLEGGFVVSIDRDIAAVFLNHVLCKMDAMDPNTIVAIQDALNTLEQLKKELNEM